MRDSKDPDGPVLRFTGAEWTAFVAGVQDGDLLVSTEGGGTTIAIRCEATCSVTQVAQATNGGHIEGHIIAVAD